MSLQGTPNLISGLGPFNTSSIYTDIDQLPNYEYNASRTGMTANSLAQLRAELHPTQSLATVPNLISGLGAGPFSPAYLYQDLGQLGNYALTATRSGLHSSSMVLPGYALTAKKNGPGAPENAGLLERLNLQTTPNLISGLNGQRFKDAILYQDIQQAGNFLQGRSGMDPYKGSAYDLNVTGFQPNPYGPGSGYDYVSAKRSGFQSNPYGPGSGYDYVTDKLSGMRATAELIGQFDISGQFNLPVNVRALKPKSRLEGLISGVRQATQLPNILNSLSINLPLGGLKKKFRG